MQLVNIFFFHPLGEEIKGALGSGPFISMPGSFTRVSAQRAAQGQVLQPLPTFLPPFLTISLLINPSFLKTRNTAWAI